MSLAHKHSSSLFPPSGTQVVLPALHLSSSVPRVFLVDLVPWDRGGTSRRQRVQDTLPSSGPTATATAEEPVVCV